MSNEFKKTIKINPEIFNVGGKTKKVARPTVRIASKCARTIIDKKPSKHKVNKNACNIYKCVFDRTLFLTKFCKWNFIECVYSNNTNGDNSNLRNICKANQRTKRCSKNP